MSPRAPERPRGRTYTAGDPEPAGPANTADLTTLAQAVVRAERSLTRQAARVAAGPRIAAARYADTLAVLALLLPWAEQHYQNSTFARNGLQSSGLVASLALMGIVLRQVVLTTVAAQPDRRGPLTLTLVGAVTGGASMLALTRLPVLAGRQGSAHVAGLRVDALHLGAPHLQLSGPLLYLAATAVAAVCTVLAGRSVASSAPAPDLLAGLYLARVEDVRVRLDAAAIAVGERTADPLPVAGVLGMVVAVAGAQADWADPFAVRWLLAAALGVVLASAVAPVRRFVAAGAQVVAGGVSMLLTLRAVLTADSGVAEANGAWLTLAGTIVTTLAGVTVLLGRHARRVQVR